VRPCRGRDPVTNGEHLAFMGDGGYARRELWTGEGWRWRERTRAEAPLYWTRDGAGGWAVRRFDRTASVEPDMPVCHVSAHEAEAHARWAGARLPTEAEWECAAAGHGDGPAQANLDQLTFGTAPRGAYAAGSAAGCRQMLGDVWEWTATPFGGYPGFRAFPYREYAEVFFGGPYRVLRGGSWATQRIAARVTFRNWDRPERRQIFSGFRLAWDPPR
jgi:gamma-glutamyl hercynylcysteine S-oxide synthase